MWLANWVPFYYDSSVYLVPTLYVDIELSVDIIATSLLCDFNTFVLFYFSTSGIECESSYWRCFLRGVYFPPHKVPSYPDISYCVSQLFACLLMRAAKLLLTDAINSWNQKLSRTEAHCVKNGFTSDLTHNVTFELLSVSNVICPNIL